MKTSMCYRTHYYTTMQCSRKPSTVFRFVLGIGGYNFRKVPYSLTLLPDTPNYWVIATDMNACAIVSDNIFLYVIIKSAMLTWIVSPFGEI